MGKFCSSLSFLIFVNFANFTNNINYYIFNFTYQSFSNFAPKAFLLIETRMRLKHIKLGKYKRIENHSGNVTA